MRQLEAAATAAAGKSNPKDGGPGNRDGRRRTTGALTEQRHLQFCREDDRKQPWQHGDQGKNRSTKRKGASVDGRKLVPLLRVFAPILVFGVWDGFRRDFGRVAIRAVRSVAMTDRHFHRHATTIARVPPRHSENLGEHNRTGDECPNQARKW